jgi:hypothetical protein
MPNHYVEDYEQVTGKKPEPAPVDTMQTEAKVVEAPKKAPAKKATAKVETK